MARMGLGEHAKKSGRCPFHEDKSNSFSVFKNDKEQWRWNCFAGCGHGDEIDFLAKCEGLSKPDACRRIIALAGARRPCAGARTAAVQCQRPFSKLRVAKPVGIMPDSVAAAWNEGVDYLLANPPYSTRLASFRGWPAPFAQHLIDCAAISMPLLRDRGNERGLAFQVVAPEGARGTMATRPIGYHVRLKGNSDEKVKWQYFPNERSHKQRIPALPFILGEFERARTLVITEGQWDALTFALAAGWLGQGCLWPENVGLIGMRGASGTNAFLQYYDRFWPERPRCLLLADSDKAGSSWSEGEHSFAKQLAKRCEKIAVVDCYPYKDFNDLYRSQQPIPEVIGELLASHGMAVEGGVTA